MTADPSRVWLRLIHINDVYVLENLASFKTLVDQESKGPDQVLVILAGDFLSPSLLSSLDHGKGMVDCMNASGITHVCLGNHETDIPPAALVERIEESNFRWINTNMRELDDKLSVETTPYQVLEIASQDGSHTKNVALLGLLTDDSSLYRPGAFAGASIEPVIETTEKFLETTAQSQNLHLIVPLTHQSMSEDRVFAHKFGNTFPLVVGGHDHEPYDETINGCRILKTGCDATDTGIADLMWTNNEATKPTLTTRLVPTNMYAPNTEMLKRIEAHGSILYELEKARLFCIKDWLAPGESVFSTFENRLCATNGSRILTSILRMGMRATCAVVNAGSIRGNRIYENKSWFTWQDLKAELPFPTTMTTVQLPGHVLECMIGDSRRGMHQVPQFSSGGFLQTCDKIVFNDDTNKIESIAGQPFDSQKLYWTALPMKMFFGVDNHVELLEWAATNDIVMNEEAGRAGKTLVVEVFSAFLWLELGSRSFAELDINGDGRLSREEIKIHVEELFGHEVADLVLDNIMGIADMDGTGSISPMELMVTKFVATDLREHIVTDQESPILKRIAADALDRRLSHEQVLEVAREIKCALDKSGDNKIDRSEFMSALGNVQRKNVLEGEPH